MDPIPSHKAGFEDQSGFSRSQILQLEILEESFRTKYGANAVLLEEFLKASLSSQWPIFTLLYPKVSFLLEQIVDVIREADKLFVDEYEIKLYGIQNPLLYVGNSRINDWVERFDVIVAAGPRSSLWSDIVWEFKMLAKRIDDGSVIAELNSSLVGVTEDVLGHLEKTIETIKVHCNFLTSRLAMIKRFEAELARETVNRGRILLSLC
jgi:hypothetical protein